MEIDLSWKGGKLEEAVIRSVAGNRCRLHAGATPLEVIVDDKTIAQADAGRGLAFDTRPDGVYVVRPR